MINKYMGTKSLVVMASNLMDTNKKPDRNENELVRIPSAVREALNITDGKLDFSWKDKDGITRHKSFGIMRAYAKDLAHVKTLHANGKFVEEDLLKVCFLTSRNYEMITGEKSNSTSKDFVKEKLWISDTIEDIMMGADPEFLLFDRMTGRIVHANSLSISEYGVLGYDHNGAMAEVRPAPYATTEGLVTNIKNAFKGRDSTACEIIRHSPTAECWHINRRRTYPVGGHIHFGNPNFMEKMNSTDKKRVFNVVNKILDELLAVPMMKLDGSRGKYRRIYTNYGNLGDWRYNNGRFEYRTLSGMWLMHPEVTAAVFGVARAIITEFYNNAKNHNFSMDYMCPEKFRTSTHSKLYSDSFTEWKSIPVANDMGCVANSKTLRDKLKESNISRINGMYLSSWYKKMKQMESYGKFSLHIDRLYDILKIPFKEIDLYKHDNNLVNTWVHENRFVN